MQARTMHIHTMHQGPWRPVAPCCVPHAAPADRSAPSGRSREEDAPGRSSKPKPRKPAGKGTSRPARTVTAPRPQTGFPGDTRSSRSRAAYDHDDDDLEYDDMDSVVEQEGDEVVLDPEEAERLIFGGKDFTQDDPGTHASAGPGSQAASQPGDQGQHKRLTAQDRHQQAVAACRAALVAAGHPASLVDLAVTAVDHGSAASDPVSLSQAVQRVTEAARASRASMGASTGHEGCEVTAAVRGLQQALGGEEQVPLVDALAAALRVPRVLTLKTDDIRQRCQDLAPLLATMDKDGVAQACAEHPELLVAHLDDIRKKLTVFKNTTGAVGYEALDMMTPYMFPGVL